MTEAELQKNVAEDLKAVLEEARSMGCTEVKAFHHIPLKNVAVVVDALEKQIPKKHEITKISCGITFGICPNCGEEINRLDNPFYHKDADCLQKLDWSEA